MGTKLTLIADGPTPLKIEGHFEEARLRHDDPLGQRALLALKIEGGIFGHIDRRRTPLEHARDVREGVLELCADVHNRCWYALSKAVLGREYDGQVESPTHQLKLERDLAETERDAAIKRAEEAELRLDELRRLFGSPPEARVLPTTFDDRPGREL